MQIYKFNHVNIRITQKQKSGRASTTSLIHETYILANLKMKGKNGNQQQAMEGTILDPIWHLLGIMVLQTMNSLLSSIFLV